ncbi:hypothetical protein L873DRAFT_1837256 [Choiromyces venosus 120613-1]|uniref:BZIP domain-containing protein n=1 Tax=Choiromyces venosus 120613-1 TaxID=1336337 RepID=A0A3N4JAC8_9PEZI|nr:hypothetical protein L873DRAFT_1837256 [Choiromyces venosus 120613-1]
MDISIALAQQSAALNTPGFFASAFMEMNIFEQCFSAAAPSDPKNNNASTITPSISINTTSSSSAATSAQVAPPSSSPGSLNPITPVSASQLPTLSPKSTMDNYNSDDYSLPTIFGGVDHTGASREEIERRYGQNRWATQMVDTTAVVQPSVIQPHLSPPYSPQTRSPTERLLMPSVEMGDTMSPLHNMLVNYSTETRSAHGQITPPEDPIIPLTPGQQGGGIFDDDDDNDTFNQEYTILTGAQHHQPSSSSSRNNNNNQPSAETDSSGRGMGMGTGGGVGRGGGETGGVVGRPRGRTNNRGRSSSRRCKKTGADDESAKEAKRQKFLERNRIAASKCRRKKKQWTQNLEDTAREVQALSKTLNKHVSVLRDELLHLKGELLKHNGCSCERIKQYLMNEATRVVEGSSAATASAATASSGTNALHQTSRQRQMSQSSDLGFSAQFDDLSDTSSVRFAMDSRSPEDTGGGMGL